MQIKELVVTDEEMNLAITQFLNWRGVDVKVSNVEGKGYPRYGWRISLDCEPVIDVTLPAAPPIEEPI